MLKTFSACTLEIDDPDLAVDEILEQLDLEHRLMEHALGLINCHPDYLHAGTVKALCARLPFEVIGGTSLLSATNNTGDHLLLSVFVLTSDDTSFAAVLTESLQDKAAEHISAAWARASSSLSSAPVLILTYVPFSRNFSGERLVEYLNRVSGGVPIFGPVVSDPHGDFSEAYTIHNGEHFKDRLPLALLAGPIRPSFFLASSSEDKVHGKQALITDSDGVLLKEVNGVNALAYLESIGLISNGVLDERVSITIPLIVDYHDGSKPSARGIYSVTPEGYIFCGGEVPKGASFALGDLDVHGILDSAAQTMKEIMAVRHKNGLLVSCCITRGLALGETPLEEAQKIHEHAGDALPYQLCYAGGEFCPVYNSAGEVVNRFHNFTFTACLL
ncbi:MAG: FIST C-terminal domain-containing protein [Deltaproteobacteria bacterium]|jgi:hypothetical protein|nr:FIST C-terminal domain-containing protein [Deltaproteobacteria bacterium]